MNPRRTFRFSMRTKFIAIILLMLLPLVMVVTIGRGFLLPKMAAAVNDIVEELTRELSSTSELQNLVSAAVMPPHDFIITGAPGNLQEFTRLSKTIDEAFKTGGKHFELAAEKKYFRLARNEWETAKTLGQEILKDAGESNNQTAIDKMRRFDRHIDLSIKNLSRVKSSINNETKEQRAAITAVIFQISFIAVLFIFITTLTAVFIGMLLSRDVLKPIKKLETAAVKLSSGDLAYRIDNHRDDELGRLAGEFNLMAERLERSYKLLKTLSIHDQLTGLYNRHEFYRRLKEEIRRYERYGHSFSLIMIDIDLFKKINDEFGHQAGDSALYFIAQELKKELRPTDHLCRYGGDEFIAILPETHLNGALSIAKRAHQRIAAGQIEVKSGPRIKLTISIGIAGFPGDANSVDELVSAADQAMFSAKAAGRNQVRVFKGAA